MEKITGTLNQLSLSFWSHRVSTDQSGGKIGYPMAFTIIMHAYFNFIVVVVVVFILTFLLSLCLSLGYYVRALWLVNSACRPLLTDTIYENCGYKHDKTTQACHVVLKNLSFINDLTFRVPQHTFSEMTVGCLSHSLGRVKHGDKTRWTIENTREM